MSDWKTTSIDDPSQWPTEHKIELEAPHQDARGSIQQLINYPSKNISLITSTKGTVRSNHYHKTDWHYMYILSGVVDYYYRKVGSELPPEKLRLIAGEMVFTPPMEEHATVFLEDTTLLAISRNPRDQASYEEDVVRTILIEPKVFAEA
jgi:quercetin dioxygenase-like cupin family protein